ncbi:MAG: hypothetical protein JO210_20455 [Acidobacteriaceae bacterium]|nr:hypothetical protein [Acidobacteriaceae bacterium]
MNRDTLKYHDVIAIRQYLEELAVCDELSGSPLPSPELIWWRSRLAEKRRLAERSVIAIETVRTAAIVVSAVFIVFTILFWAPPLFGDLPLPLPLSLASLILFGCSTGGVLLAWARQR